MMARASSPPLVALLRLAQAQALPFRELIRRAAGDGVPLPELIDAIEFGDFYFDDGRGRDEAGVHLPDDGGDAWIEDLVAELGGEAEAQAVIAQTRYWSIDVPTQREDRRVRRMLEAAITDPSRPGRLAYALAAAGKRDGVAGMVPEALAAVVRQWPLPTVVQQPWFPVSVLRLELPRRGSWPEVLAHLVQSLGRGPAVDAVARIVGVTVPEGSERERYWHLRCRLASLAGTPLWSVVTPMMAELDDPTWVAVARAHGFPASEAALGLLEAGRSLRVTAATLSAAGWTAAEVLAALIAREAAPIEALRAWHDGGFSEDGMVAGLRRARLSDEEIARLLGDLRVPEARIERLLRGR